MAPKRVRFLGINLTKDAQICTLKTIKHHCRRRQWQPTPVLLPGKPHGWRSLVGCSPWGREESDTTERLHFHFSLSCTGEGNGNPLQCSCLENPRDGGAWWAAVYGVAQSQTGLKRLSSSHMWCWWLPFLEKTVQKMKKKCIQFQQELLKKFLKEFFKNSLLQN